MQKENRMTYRNKYIVLGKRIIEIVFVAFLIMIVEYYYFGLNKWDFKIPVTYDGGDAFSGIAAMKMKMMGDNYRMGWPYYEDVTKYSPVFNMLSRIGSGVIGIFIDDYFVGQNIFLFLIPTANVLVCYFVFNSLKIRKWLSLLGAFIYGFCPYVQMRMYLHQDLAAVECIPIIFMICIWLYEEDDFAKPMRHYFKNKKNVLLVVLSWMIANNGIVYYPFFSCFIVLVTGVLVCVREKTIRKISSSFMVIANIVFWLFIGFLPAIKGMLVGYGDVATNGTTRDAYRSTLYGLDIRSLLLSPKGFGIKNLLPLYGYLFEFDKEQYYAYLGIIGIIGFFVLLFFLFYGNFNEDRIVNRILLLSKINIMLLLLGTSCGLGVIVAIFIPFIASYNRISIFIMFASVLTMVLVGEHFLDKSLMNRKKSILIVAVIVVLSLLSFVEQMRSYNHFSDTLLEDNSTKLAQDKTFFAKVEESAGTNSMVFVLPYMSAFENLQQGNIYDYDHYRGYLNTNTIRWSYGAVNGRKNDVWYKNTSELEPDAMINELRDKGFAGIYINVDGYDNDEGKLLTNRLLKVQGDNKYILHESGLLVYIPIDK